MRSKYLTDVTVVILAVVIGLLVVGCDNEPPPAPPPPESPQLGYLESEPSQPLTQLASPDDSEADVKVRNKAHAPVS